MPTSQPLSGTTPAQLQSAYLQCNQLALTTMLDFGTAARCSMVYEELKQRVFGGDFERLHAWSQQQPDAVAARAGAAEAPQP